MGKKVWTASEMGKVGGKRRAEVLTEKERRTIARKAGKARAASMTKQERKALAVKAAKGRWGKAEKAEATDAPKQRRIARKAII
jgi:hypothetical protein